MPLRRPERPVTVQRGRQTGRHDPASRGPASARSRRLPSAPWSAPAGPPPGRLPSKAPTSPTRAGKPSHEPPSHQPLPRSPGVSFLCAKAGRTTAGPFLRLPARTAREKGHFYAPFVQRCAVLQALHPLRQCQRAGIGLLSGSSGSLYDRRSGLGPCPSRPCPMRDCRRRHAGAHHQQKPDFDPRRPAPSGGAFSLAGPGNRSMAAGQ